MNGYPLQLDLRGKAVAVVGGGPVAARRALSCHAAGAVVTVISPWAVEELVELSRSGELHWQAREYQGPADLMDAWLVHTATGDRRVDEAVSADAAALRLWCVRADDAEASSAWTVAHRHVDGLTIGVSAEGDPRRAVRALEQLVASASTTSIDSRRCRPGTGSVALIGAGPGDPELLTVRARMLLNSADVVVADRLAPRELGLDGRDGVEFIDVGKSPGQHAMAQEDINALLVDLARSGKRVARVKGGDPFVLGRGGEEVAACAAAGVPIEVVPGVTSAVAVPAAAGIPVTHRGIATSFFMASAHSGVPDMLKSIEQAPSDATLVLLMGVGRLSQITQGLLRSGRSASLPVAVIESGWTPQQRVTVSTLESIADESVRMGIQNPAVIVIGEVVSLREIWGDLGRISGNAGHDSLTSR